MNNNRCAYDCDSVDAFRYAMEYRCVDPIEIMRRQLIETQEQLIRERLMSSHPIFISKDLAVRIPMQSKKTSKLPEIDKVVVNEKNGYTIVKFANGDVEKVHCGEGDTFDAEKAIAIAIAKYAVTSSKLHKAINGATIIKKENK